MLMQVDIQWRRSAHTRETNDDGDSIHVCMRGSLTTSVQTTVVFSLIVHRIYLLHAIPRTLPSTV